MDERSLSWSLALVMVCGACSGGGGSPALPDGGALGEARCIPGLAGTRVTDATADLALAVDGQAVAALLDPGATYAAGPLISSAMPAVCADVRRQDPPAGERLDWLSFQIHALFHGGGSEPVVALSLPTPIVPSSVDPFRPYLEADLDEAGATRWTAFSAGRTAAEPNPLLCGERLTVRFEDLAGELDDARPVTLGGTFELTLPGPIDDPLASDPVAPLTPCEGDEMSLQDVVASDTAALPFEGGCWAEGSRIQAGAWQLGFRARPGSQPFDPFGVVPWVTTIVLPHPDDLSAGMVLQVTAPAALVDPRPDEIEPGTAWATIANNLDGVLGPDWRATGGTIEIASIERFERPDSMFDDFVMEASFAIAFQAFTPCDQPLALTDEVVMVTGRLLVDETVD